jgi:hypothetical protein
VTPFTLVMAYYDNPSMLQHHIRTWLGFDEALRQALHVIIVDDGSPRWHAKEVCDGIRAKNLGHDDGLASFQLWRMGVDVRWNQDACRNVGVREALTQWVVLTDMDHVVPAETWEYLMCHPLDPRHIYTFARVTAPDLVPYRPHLNSWAITTDKYWQVGGYDEALAGNYGTDGDFNRRARRTAAIVDLKQWLVRYTRGLVRDANTTTLERKTVEDRLRIDRLYNSRRPDWRPLHFSFPCDRVALGTRIQ